MGHVRVRSSWPRSDHWRHWHNWIADRRSPRPCVGSRAAAIVSPGDHIAVRVDVVRFPPVVHSRSRCRSGPKPEALLQRHSSRCRCTRATGTPVDRHSRIADRRSPSPCVSRRLDHLLVSTLEHCLQELLHARKLTPLRLRRVQGYHSLWQHRCVGPRPSPTRRRRTSHWHSHELQHFAAAIGALTRSLHLCDCAELAHRSVSARKETHGPRAGHTDQAALAHILRGVNLDRDMLNGEILVLQVEILSSNGSKLEIAVRRHGPRSSTLSARVCHS